MHVLICGDRNWTDTASMRNCFFTFPTDTVIIESEARGADRMAATYAAYFDFTVMRFPANWAKYGKAAGPIRNQQMLDEGKPDLVVFFHKDLASSKGTKDVVIRAKKAGVPVIDGWETYGRLY